MITIYKIINRKTNKIFIGLTSQKIYSALNQHLYALRGNRSHSDLFIDEYHRYGRNSFKVESLGYTIDKSRAIKLKKYFIKKYNSMTPNGYNQKVE